MAEFANKGPNPISFLIALGDVAKIVLETASTVIPAALSLPNLLSAGSERRRVDTINSANVGRSGNK